MMRRKAQAVMAPPSSTASNADAMLGQFLSALGGPGSPANELPVMVQELENGETPLNAKSEQDEHCAFQCIHDAIDHLCKALDTLDDHEELEKEEGIANKGDKKEVAAIKKMRKCLEELKEAEKDLHEGEKVETEEKVKEAAKEDKKEDKSEVTVIEVEEEPEIPDLE